MIYYRHGSVAQWTELGHSKPKAVSSNLTGLSNLKIKDKLNLSDTKTDVQLASLFGGSTVMFVIPLAVLLRAWVFTQLWLWFVVQQFHVAPLPMLVAYGLTLLVALLVPHNPPKSDPIDTVEGAITGTMTALIQMLMPSLVSWGCGLIAHLLVH